MGINYAEGNSKLNLDTNFLSVQEGGIVNVRVGSRLSSNGVDVGTLAGSAGVVNVTGTGSELTGSALTVGQSGSTGSINILGGATANLSSSLALSNSTFANSSANLNVTGGSVLTVGGSVFAGLGAQTGQATVINVSGANSRIQQNGARTFFVGGNANSTSQVTVSGGGRINTGTGGLDVRRTGTVNVLAGSSLNVPGDITVNGGTVSYADGTQVFSAGRQLSVSGGGTYSGGDVQFFGDGVAAKATVDGAGSQLLSQAIGVGFGTSQGELTLSNGGRVVSTGSFFTGPLGRIEGNGTLEGSTIRNNGVVAPGLSAGTLNVNGNFRQEATGKLEIELGGVGPGQSDLLSITGNATLNGDLLVSLTGGFTPGLGQAFEIIDAGGLSGGFAGLSEGDLVGNFGGTNLFITYEGGDGNDVVLRTPSFGDFDFDFDVDIDDIDFYSGKIGQSAAGQEHLDLNNDNTITLEDHFQHVTTLVETDAGVGAFLGDLNLDGDVDISQIVSVNGVFNNVGDASLLLSFLGATGGAGYRNGDLNADGDVDISQLIVRDGQLVNVGDASILLSNLGQGAGNAAASSSAVPEPGSLILLTLAGLAGCGVRRRNAWV